MAQFYKHVGRIVNSDRRCVVAFRELPNDPKNCLVIDTDALPDRFHDGVMTAVENQIAQETVEFYKYLQRNSFVDGTNMLTALHNKGWLVKQPTTNVVMLPAPNQKIELSELNDQLRKLGFDVYADEEEAKKNCLSILTTYCSVPGTSRIAQMYVCCTAALRNVLTVRSV